MTSPARCPTCDAPADVIDGRTRIPHLSWCRWSPRARPPVVVLPVPAYLDADADADDQTEDCP